MMTTHSALVTMFAVSMMLTAALSAQAQQGPDYQYAIIDLGDIGGRGNNAALAINNQGVVVGDAAFPSRGLEAFVWTNGKITILERNVSNGVTFPLDINEAGDIVGRDRDENGENRAVLWPGGGSPIDLGTFGGPAAAAEGINSLGQIVGLAEFEVTGFNPFLWENDKMIALGDFGDPAGSAKAINDRGQIVGYARGDGFSGNRAFLWENGSLIKLTELGWRKDSVAHDINEASLIVGSTDNLISEARAVLWEDQQIRLIHNGGLGIQSSARACNESGQVVGWLLVDDSPHETSAFLYENDGPMVDLADLLPPRHAWDEIGPAEDINDLGQIVGGGEHNSGSGRPYLITPVRTRMTLAQPVPGLSGTVNTLSVTGATPGKRVYFCYSTVGGGTMVPGCSHTDGIVLQMNDVTVIGSAVANENGEASIDRFVPNGATNLGDILIQAVQVSGCRMSQLVVELFE